MRAEYYVAIFAILILCLIIFCLFRSRRKLVEKLNETNKDLESEKQMCRKKVSMILWLIGDSLKVMFKTSLPSLRFVRYEVVNGSVLYYMTLDKEAFERRHATEYAVQEFLDSRVKSLDLKYTFKIEWLDPNSLVEDNENYGNFW